MLNEQRWALSVDNWFFCSSNYNKNCWITHYYGKQENSKLGKLNFCHSTKQKLAGKNKGGPDQQKFVIEKFATYKYVIEMFVMAKLVIAKF